MDYVGDTGAGAVRRAIAEENALSQHTTTVETVSARPAMSPDQGKTGSKDLLQTVLASLEDDKAEDVISITLEGRSQMADHMVIASGRSSRQVVSISEKLAERLKHECGVIARTEGKEAGDWVLIDAGDVIVHMFRPEVREFYQLEKMWQSPAQPRQGSV